MSVLERWLRADSVVTADDLRKHVLAHAKHHRSKGCGAFYVVTTELKVFKAAEDHREQRVIVALTIPVGAKFYLRKDGLRNGFGGTIYTAASNSNSRKMRASEAHVHSIWRLDKNGTPVRASAGYSKFDKTFVYKPGTVVTPRNPFSMSDDECESGIHFFVNFRDAWYY